MSADISFNNALAVANTQLIRTYTFVDPRVRILVMILKHWAKQRHVNSAYEHTLSRSALFFKILFNLSIPF